MAAPADPTSAAQPPVPVAVEPPITLGQFVKLADLAATGGDAKRLIAAGLVRVNDQVEQRRGHKLALGDVVAAQGAAAVAVARGTRERSGRSSETVEDLAELGRPRSTRESPGCSSVD